MRIRLNESGEIARQQALSAVYERMTTARVLTVHAEISSSAATNQRVVCRSSLRARTGRSQRGAVSFSATSCTRVSIKMSFTRFAPIPVVDTSHNPPTEVDMTRRKASGLIQGGPSVKHKWLYISRSTERHCEFHPNV